MGEKLYVTLLFRLSSENQQNFKIDLIRRKKDYYASKPSINYQQMAGAALHKEINAMWSRVILPGCKNSLFTVIFLSQIKMSIMSLPCYVGWLVGLSVCWSVIILFIIEFLVRFGLILFLKFFFFFLKTFSLINFRS